MLLEDKCSPNFGTFESSFLHYKNVTRQYEDPEILKSIKELIPVSILEGNRLESLLTWYKNFMQWTPNQIICRKCTGNNNNSRDSVIMQTKVDPGNSWRVGKIEVHRCNQCGETKIFPRYNDVLKIAESRTGRCGEWSILFGAILNSLSMESRIVHDYLDHCWNEVYLGDRWYHVDSSLQYPDSIDHPYYYERNWKKQYTYVLAFSPNTIDDVTKTYTERWNDVLLRRQALIQGRSTNDIITDFQNSYSEIKPSY